MQIGLMTNPASDPVREIEVIGDAGFDFVDLALEPPNTDWETMKAGVAGMCRRQLESMKLGVVAHTPFYLPLGSPFRLRWVPGPQ